MTALIVLDGCRTIQLTQGYVALVDEADFPALSLWRWKVLKAGTKRYASRSRKHPGRRYSTILMHREIAADPSAHRRGWKRTKRS